MTQRNKAGRLSCGAVTAAKPGHGCRPLKLLETLAGNDYGMERAAQALHMSGTAADKQLAEIHDHLGAKTTYGALFNAIKPGLINVNGCADQKTEETS